MKEQILQHQKNKIISLGRLSTANERQAHTLVHNAGPDGLALYRNILQRDPKDITSFLKTSPNRHQQTSLILNLQQRIGNQATYSALSSAGILPERNQGGCTCGGRCGHSTQNTTKENPRRKPPDEEPEYNLAPVHRDQPCRLAAPLMGSHPAPSQARKPTCDDLPHQGSATIVCDGSGGYRVDMGWAATATCGIGDCVRRHEESHAADWRGRFPNGCKNADGTSKPNGTAVPTGGPGYEDFLKKSECKAYNVEIGCEEALLKSANAACKPTVQSVLDDSKRQQKGFCSGGC